MKRISNTFLHVANMYLRYVYANSRIHISHGMSLSVNDGTLFKGNEENVICRCHDALTGLYEKLRLRHPNRKRSQSHAVLGANERAALTLSGADATPPPPCRAPRCSYTPVAAHSAVLSV